jgi:6-phosphogluconolactonase
MKKMIRFILTWLLLSWSWLVSAYHPDQKSSPQTGSYVFYLGTYTNGESKGIYKYLLKEDGTIQPLGLKAETSNPSYLAFSADHRFLMAVNENDPGTVSVFSVEPDTLLFHGSQPSGGDFPCYISVNPDGWVLTANYGSGTVGLLALETDGRLSPLLDVQKHHDGDLRPHAHCAMFYPGTRHVIAADLGTNRLWFSELDPAEKKLTPGPQKPLEMPKGSGPRHFVLFQDHQILYVANELGNTVSVVEKTPASGWQLLTTCSTLPAGFQGTSYVADLHLSPDNRFLYVSNRGSNTLAVFDVSDDGKSLELLYVEPVHGNWPRSFAITPDGHFLVAANQKSNDLTVFQRDISTGRLEFIGKTAAPSPVCVLFYSK